jgi:hypothetical protein
MARRYLAFDIETAKDVPGAEFNWRAHRPLGIACAAALACDASAAVLWHGKTPDGRPAARMSREEAAAMVRELARMIGEGYTLVTWNGLGFDLDVLAEESGLAAECRELAIGHVDMMFHVLCDKGFPVGLERAARGMGLAGKPEGMAGELAPRFWAMGKHNMVLDYVAQDVRIALSLAVTGDQRRRLDWLAQSGRRNSMGLGGGWLTVREAMRLPLPDTSWMANPIPRGQFTGWLKSR